MENSVFGIIFLSLVLLAFLIIISVLLFRGNTTRSNWTHWTYSGHSPYGTEYAPIGGIPAGIGWVL